MKQFLEFINPFVHLQSLFLYLIITPILGFILEARLGLDNTKSIPLAILLAFILGIINDRILDDPIYDDRIVVDARKRNDLWDLTVYFPFDEERHETGISTERLITKLHWIKYQYGSRVYIPPHLERLLSD